MDERFDLLQQILKDSKEFSFEGSVLTLRSYRTGEQIQLDLSRIDQDMFEELYEE